MQQPQKEKMQQPQKEKNNSNRSKPFIGGQQHEQEPVYHM
jgi:hypothetical protein